MATKNRSAEYFNSGYCCAESVLMTVCELNNIQSDIIPKVASGFCAGLAKTDSLCGAYTGGVLAINILTGQNEPNANRTKNYELIQTLNKYFNEAFTSTYCTKICGCNLTTVQGSEDFSKQNKKEYCTEVVEKTTDFILELLSTKR